MQTTRNDITLDLTNFKIIRGDNKDKEYPSIAISSSNLSSVLKYLGDDTVTGIVQTFIKRATQELWLDNIVDGVPNVEKFLFELKDLSAASLNKKALEEKRDELIERQNILAMLDDLTPEQIVELKSMAKEINIVKAQIDARSRKNKPEVQAEAAVAV